MEGLNSQIKSNLTNLAINTCFIHFSISSEKYIKKNLYTLTPKVPNLCLLHLKPLCIQFRLHYVVSAIGGSANPY